MTDYANGTIVKLKDGRIGIVGNVVWKVVYLAGNEVIDLDNAQIVASAGIGQLGEPAWTTTPDDGVVADAKQLVGIHGNAMSWALDADIELAKRIRAKWFLVMGGTDVNFVRRLVSELPDTRIVARLWWTPGHGGRDSIVPMWMAQYLALYDAGVRWFAVGNEPNVGGHNGEGLGTHWQNGREFGEICVQFALEAQRYHNDIVLVSGGLSPNPDLTTPEGTIVKDEKRFFADMVRSGFLEHFDVIGAHAYWQNFDGLYGAGENIDWYEQFNMPILITEYANTAPRAECDYATGLEYRKFLNVLVERQSGVIGAVAFVATAQRGQWDGMQWYSQDSLVFRGVVQGFLDGG